MKKPAHRNTQGLDVSRLVEELIEYLRTAVQPAPKPRRVAKWATLIAGLVMAALVAAIGIEARKAPGHNVADSV